VIETGVQNTSSNASVYNPALFGQLAWDLGNGFGFSYALGAYIGIDQSVAWSSTSLNQRFALDAGGCAAKGPDHEGRTRPSLVS